MKKEHKSRKPPAHQSRNKPDKYHFWGGDRGVWYDCAEEAARRFSIVAATSNGVKLKKVDHKTRCGIKPWTELWRQAVDDADEEGAEHARTQAIIQHTLIWPGPDMVVCDEGHMLRKHTSARSLSLRRVHSLRRLILTGTPMQNNLDEYHCMVDMVRPLYLGNLKEFQNQFAHPIKEGQAKDSTKYQVRKMKRRSHVLHTKLSGFVHRRSWAILRDALGPKHEHVLSVDLTPLQNDLRRAYRKYRKQVKRITGDKVGVLQVAMAERLIANAPCLLKSMTRPGEEGVDDEHDSTCKVCNGAGKLVMCMACPSSYHIECLANPPSRKKQWKCPPCVRAERNLDYGSDDGYDERAISPLPGAFGHFGALRPISPEPINNMWWEQVLDDFDGDVDDPARSSKLTELLDLAKRCDAKGEKIIVFSQSISTLDVIELALKNSSLGWTKRKQQVARIEGSVSAGERQAICRRFNSSKKSKTVLISTRAVSREKSEGKGREGGRDFFVVFTACSLPIYSFSPFPSYLPLLSLPFHYTRLGQHGDQSLRCEPRGDLRCIVEPRGGFAGDLPRLPLRADEARPRLPPRRAPAHGGEDLQEADRQDGALDARRRGSAHEAALQHR